MTIDGGRNSEREIHGRATEGHRVRRQRHSRTCQPWPSASKRSARPATWPPPGSPGFCGTDSPSPRPATTYSSPRSPRSPRRCSTRRSTRSSRPARWRRPRRPCWASSPGYPCTLMLYPAFATWLPPVSAWCRSATARPPWPAHCSRPQGSRACRRCGSPGRGPTAGPPPAGASQRCRRRVPGHLRRLRRLRRDGGWGGRRCH